eukprot:TRINITY_DN52102_c0_g1_i1.p1 TRINITY_DN52102_c0_g1~~TRINITY_DN52102_c0_g1_i1.p1  ORF type:complete len:261 (-),score=56.72 TRINITY_DN52102_c0_g1_i1:22-804(-)
MLLRFCLAALIAAGAVALRVDDELDNVSTSPVNEAHCPRRRSVAPRPADVTPEPSVHDGPGSAAGLKAAEALFRQPRPGVPRHEPYDWSVSAEPNVSNDEEAKDPVKLPRFMEAERDQDQASLGFKLFGEGLCLQAGEAKVMQPGAATGSPMTHDECARRCTADARCLAFTDRPMDGLCRMQMVSPTEVDSGSSSKGMRCWKKNLATDRLEFLHVRELRDRDEAAAKQQASADWERARANLQSYGVQPEGWSNGMWRRLP